MDKQLEFYLDTMVAEGSRNGVQFHPRNLKFQMESVFEGVELMGKRILDIGGGIGLFSFYAASRGASKVVCLEPEAEGSTSKSIVTFERLKERLGYPNAYIEPVPLQEFDPKGDKFDIILLHNSINHLDEEACINLLTDKKAKEVYKTTFSQLYAFSNSGSKIIICDCSRHNFFSLLKIRNPFAASIEWHKHQAPEVWRDLLSSVGFTNSRIRWSSFNRCGIWGKWLLGNRFMAYFLRSHFSLCMEKPAGSR